MKQYKIASYDDLDERKLMDVYQESNIANIDYFYPEMTDKSLALQKVEQRFLAYLQKEFFGRAGNEYRILEEDRTWISALRLYRIREGLYYIEALETHPAFRRQGYAARLLNGVMEELKRNGSFQLCDCVRKRNEASVYTHRKCGFQIVPGPAVDYLRGESDEDSYGMQYKFEIRG